MKCDVLLSSRRSLALSHPIAYVYMLTISKHNETWCSRDCFLIVTGTQSLHAFDAAGARTQRKKARETQEWEKKAWSTGEGARFGQSDQESAME